MSIKTKNRILISFIILIPKYNSEFNHCPNSFISVGLKTQLKSLHLLTIVLPLSFVIIIFILNDCHAFISKFILFYFMFIKYCNTLLINKTNRNKNTQTKRLFLQKYIVNWNCKRSIKINFILCDTCVFYSFMERNFDIDILFWLYKVSSI